MLQKNWFDDSPYTKPSWFSGQPSGEKHHSVNCSFHHLENENLLLSSLPGASGGPGFADCEHGTLHSKELRHAVASSFSHFRK